MSAQEFMIKVERGFWFGKDKRDGSLIWVNSVCVCFKGFSEVVCDEWFVDCIEVADWIIVVKEMRKNRICIFIIKN